MGSVTMVFQFLTKLIPWIAGESDLVSNSIFNLNKWTCKTIVSYFNAKEYNREQAGRMYFIEL